MSTAAVSSQAELLKTVCFNIHLASNVSVVFKLFRTCFHTSASEYACHFSWVVVEIIFNAE